MSARIRARYAELYDERSRTEAQLKALLASAVPENYPEPLDQLPIATAAFTDAPDRIKAALLTAFDIQALYRHDQDQITIWATITGDTPRTIDTLLADPRTDSDTCPATPDQDAVYHSAPGPIARPTIHHLHDRVSRCGR
jgi:hypothetical protein